MPTPWNLGPISPQIRIGWWIAQQLLMHQTRLPVADRAAKWLTTDGGDLISRIGDVLVWNSPHGKRVLGGLEQVSESQRRIDNIVNHIDVSQVAATASLGTLHSLSILTLGITSLSAGYMHYRFQALQRQITQLGQQLSAIEANIQAQQRARLDTGINFLEKYELNRNPQDLRVSLECSTESTNHYGNVLRAELEYPQLRRVQVLNHISRCYLLALVTELRCHILADNLNFAVRRLKDKQPIFRQ